MNRVLINAANLNKGGGVQVATSLIINFKNLSDMTFYYVVSEEVWSEIRHIGLAKDSVKIFKSDKLRGVKKLIRVKKILDESERIFSPDAALSIFGPVFWRPKCIHLCGFAIPHYLYHDESPFFNNLSFKNRLSLWLLEAVHLRLLKYSSDGFYTETEDASKRLAAIINRHVYTISNALNDKLICNVSNNLNAIDSPAKVIIVSSNYPHKNLDILSEVDKILEEMDINIEFHFTLSDFPVRLRQIRNHINHGRVNLEELGKLYGEVDALLLPTLLECFTASYLEASYFNIPIITSDLSFARTLCKEDAVYFDPINPISIAEKLKYVFESQSNYEQLASRSGRIHKRYPSANVRAINTIDILLELYEINSRRF